MKLFKRKKKLTSWEQLDKVMSKMASTDTYIEYLRLREGN